MFLGAIDFGLFLLFGINKTYYYCACFFLFVHFVHSKGDIRPSYRLSYICRICARIPVLHLHLLTSRDCLINDTTFRIIRSHTRFSYSKCIWYDHTLGHIIHIHVHFQPWWIFDNRRYISISRLLWSLMIYAWQPCIITTLTSSII